MRHSRLLTGIWVSVGLLAALWVSPASAQPGFNPPGLDVAIAAQERHTDNLLRIQGVVGTAVGLGAGGQPVVKIYTEAPGVPGLPRSLDGVPAVVQVTGKIFALHHRPGHGGGPGGGGEDADPVDPTDRFPRPVPIGVSTGHPAITAGTIGARVVDTAGYVFALSNNHVYADENLAFIEDPVLQPGTFDGGTDPADVIGTLDGFVPIDFSASASNMVDAAIALSATADLGKATPFDGYGTPRSTTLTPRLRLKVMKYGRTTGLTSNGRISGINGTVDVGYSSGVARFVGQIIIQPGSFSAPGDSGSLVVARGGADALKPVGLVFAGSSLVTVANSIDAVLAAFGVGIDGQQ